VIGEIIAAAGAIYGANEGRKADIATKGHLKAEGIAKQKSAEFSAKQMEVNAGQELATSQRNAAEELRVSEAMQSRALAIAGASGAGADDPTMRHIIGSIAEEGQLAAQAHLYQGTEAARSLRLSAEVARWEGKKAREGLNVQGQGVMQAGDINRTANLIGTAASVWDKYDTRKNG
jgi:hypothetical protein